MIKFFLPYNMASRLKRVKSQRPNPDLKKNQNQKGQLVIEYVLLLMVVALVATLLTNLLIGRGGLKGQKGLVIQKWQIIVRTIVSDIIDE